MNVLESSNIENPYGKSDECAMLTITDPVEWFILHDLMTVGQNYTFNAWIKSNVYGGVTIGDSHFSIETEWIHCKGSFTAHDTDLRFIFSTPGTYYIYNAQLEIGTVATDWSPSPEDIDADISSVTNRMTEVEVGLEGFRTTVSETYVTHTKFDALNIGGRNLIRNSTNLLFEGYDFKTVD